MQTLSSYLQDDWAFGEGDGAALYDPASGEKIAHASTKGLDLAAALEHGRREGGRALRAMTFAERGALLTALSKAVHGARDELLELSRRNTGTTKRDSKFDVDGATATLAAYGAIGEELGDRRFFLDGEGEQIGRSPRFHGQHLKVPLRGVAVHINAFNFPAWGTAEKMACAFLAGVPVLTKPATATALPAWRMAQVMVESGLLPSGAFAFLCGSAGDLLDHLTAQDVVAFTGSADTARVIRAHPRVVERSVRVNVEADSLNAVVLGPDCEPGSDLWDLALRELTVEMTQKSGQKCTATRRVFAPEGLIEPLLETLRERLLDVPIGDPNDAEVRMGPLATPAQFPDVRGLMAEFAQECEVVLGAVPSEEPSVKCLVEPTVFLCKDPHGTAIVHEKEVFGPCFTLMPYSGDAQEAAELVAKGEGGLVCSVYSDDLAFVETALFELAPWHGRILLGSKRIAEHSTGPGMVLPTLTHGGPGRAGGGLELGGLRGLDLYLQTCAVQGARPVIEKILSR